MKAFFCLLLLIPGLAFASESESCDNHCVETGQWHIGVALGLGVKTNPLHDGDNIPLLLLPDIAWYGEDFYFDNGEFGYQWQYPNSSFETFFSINKERAFFSFWHVSNVLNPVEGNSFLIGEGPAVSAAPEQRQVSVDDISRKWSVDAGVRWQQTLPLGRASISYKQDAFGVHYGRQFNLSYQLSWQSQDWYFALSPSMTWKSQKLLDYYYGIRSEDSLPDNSNYTAKAGWQPQLDFLATYPLSHDWQLLFKVGYQWLNKGMYQSPLVKEKRVKSFFLGATYQF